MTTKTTTFFWTTTSPNPRHPGTGWDAGQKGWKLHAVEANEGEDYKEYAKRPALCGTRPRHGWGVDLFIDEECARCDAAMTKREKAGETFTDLEEIAKARRQAKLLEETEEENEE